MKPYKVLYHAETGMVEVYSRIREKRVMQIPADLEITEEQMQQLNELLYMNGDADELSELQYAIQQVAVDRE